MFILNLQPSTIDFVFSILHSPSSYIKTPFSNFYSQSSALLFPSSVKSTVYMTQNFPKNSWISDKMSATAACTSRSFNQVSFLIGFWWYRIHQVAWKNLYCNWPWVTVILMTSLKLRQGFCWLNQQFFLFRYLKYEIKTSFWFPNIHIFCLPKMLFHSCLFTDKWLPHSLSTWLDALQISFSKYYSEKNILHSRTAQVHFFYNYKVYKNVYT